MYDAFDPVALIELGYQHLAEPSSWLQRLVGPVTEPLDVDQMGGMACLHVPPAFEVKGWVDRASSPSGASDYAKNQAAELASVAPERVAVMYRISQRPGIHSSAEELDFAVGETFPGFGPYRDSLVVPLHTGHEPVVFAVGRRDPYELKDSERALWRHLCAHLGAAYRLTSRDQGLDSSDVECVLTPTGEVVHAAEPCQEKDIRLGLRDAVERIDRARTRAGRSDPHAALQLWSGLFQGRWSLVDHFDTDGRRYVLARENDPHVGAPRPLPLRQRQVLFYAAAGWSNKEIGYALGIAASTVGVHLQQALARMGVASRADWARLSAETAAVAAGDGTQVE